jgi:hypothetical protein
LVTAPQATMMSACREIGLDFDDAMIRQHERDSTLTLNPRGQLSAERVKQPMDGSSIGKWREQLDDAELAAFLDGCGGSGLFERFGLEWRR